MFRTLLRFKSTSGAKNSPSVLDLRVGRIVQCRRHPQADKLYVSQVQMALISEGSSKISSEMSFKVSSEGEGVEATGSIPSGWLQICSGLVDYIPVDKMLDHRVVVLTNIPPSKLRGEKSMAMLLAGEKAAAGNESSIVKLLQPPVDSQVGDKLSFFPFHDDKFPAKLKSKKWEPIQQCLKTNAKGQAVYVAESGDEYLLKRSPDSEHAAFCDDLPNAIIR